jgi:hypothetical protein
MFDMTHSSQNLNKSYGYLWWLNGQESFMLPGVQLAFPFKLIPNAPDDMFAALGKNDQKIHIVPSKGWVVVRQGNDAGYTNTFGNSVPILFDNDMWSYLNKLDCAAVGTQELADLESLVSVYPNPTQDSWLIRSEVMPTKIELFDALGIRLKILENVAAIEVAMLPAGHYWLKVQIGDKSVLKPVVKN